MGKIAQLVLGPAGSGKSTYCSVMQEYMQTTGAKRVCHVINLDPAAEAFDYEPTVDIRELVTVDDVMEFTDLGPNGGLVYAMEYIITEGEWLENMLGDYEDDYLLFDCPGQVELYTHYPVFTKLARVLENNGYRVVGVYLVEYSKISFSTILDSICAYAALGITQFCVASKADLIPAEERIDPMDLCARSFENPPSSMRKLSEAFMKYFIEPSMPYFDILDIEDKESIGYLVDKIDMATQFDEDAEPREPQDINDYDGDIGYSGDYFNVNGSQLDDANDGEYNYDMETFKALGDPNADAEQID